MATPKNEKYSRIMYLLAFGCTKVTRAFILKKVRDSSPMNHNPFPWTLDDFLNQNKQDIVQTNYGSRKDIQTKLFPIGFGATDIESWDLQMLCFIYSLLCNPSFVVEMDYDHFRKIRNKLCHTKNGKLSDTEYSMYMKYLTEGIQRCLAEIQDMDLTSEIKEVINSIETDVALQMEMCMETKLVDWHESEMAALTRVEVGVDRVEKEIQHTSEGIKQLSENHQYVMHHLKALVDAHGIKTDIPTTKIKLVVKNCESDNEHLLCKKIIEYMGPNIGHLADETQNEIRDAVTEAMRELLGKDVTLVEAEQKCIILHLKVHRLDKLFLLWRKCIDGRLTTLFKSVENASRKLDGFERMEIEVLLTDAEFWRFTDRLVTDLNKSCETNEQKLTYRPTCTKVTVEDLPAPDKGAFIEMTIQPESYEQLSHIIKICKNGQFNEKLSHLSEVLKSKYDISHLEIEAELEPSTTYGCDKAKSDDESRIKPPTLPFYPSVVYDEQTERKKAHSSHDVFSFNNKKVQIDSVLPTTTQSTRYPRRRIEGSRLKYEMPRLRSQRIFFERVRRRYPYLTFDTGDEYKDNNVVRRRISRDNAQLLHYQQVQSLLSSSSLDNSSLSTGRQNAHSAHAVLSSSIEEPFNNKKVQIDSVLPTTTQSTRYPRRRIEEGSQLLVTKSNLSGYEIDEDVTADISEGFCKILSSNLTLKSGDEDEDYNIDRRRIPSEQNCRVEHQHHRRRWSLSSVGSSKSSSSSKSVSSNSSDF